MKLNPNEVCDYLAARADADFKSVKFKKCIFNPSNNELISTFLFEEKIKGKISRLKPKLEQEFRASVGISDVKYLFLYKQCYMDAQRLAVLTQEFLKKNFSFLTLDLEDDDLQVAGGDSGFTVRLRLPKQAADYIKGGKAFKEFTAYLTDNNFVQFSFVFEEVSKDAKGELTLDDIEKYAESKLAASAVVRVDKSLKIGEREYLLGMPIKERPIKIEYLKTGPQEQIIAGTISFLTKREYTKRDSNEKRPYWTFVLDDGSKKQFCVYFPAGRTPEALGKNIERMQKLADGKTICVIGINEERNARVNFNVKGISTCALL